MTRIHPECYTLTATGRVTMHEPSVQNIPRDFEIHMPGERVIVPWGIDNNINNSNIGHYFVYHIYKLS